MEIFQTSRATIDPIELLFFFQTQFSALRGEIAALNPPILWQRVSFTFYERRKRGALSDPEASFRAFRTFSKS